MALFGRSFLNEASSRLQRLLNVDGVLSPKIDGEPLLLPVISVGDATDPGNNEYKGRRFAFSYAATGALGAAFKATAPLVLTKCVVILSTATGTWRIQYFGPEDADPAAGTYPNQDIILMENARSNLELAPLVRSNNIAIPAGGTIYNQSVAPLNTAPAEVTLDLFLRPNAIVYLSNGTVGSTAFFHVAGYVY